ncbi:MAG: sarcosine oxidase subunit alpha family protein [Hyphomicrobiaceae bacterium]|nr:sarcosine oxidase subunit alpha family protein [Hyphomicrobiaceae bacterium]
MSRLAQGGLIDRAKPLQFTFDGKRYSGFAGDTLASALIANDVRLVARSFKYHRPRGIVTAGSEEPNALVELRDGARREPNSRATTAELYDGLTAESQNRWPSLAFDAMAVNQLFAPFFGAAFYYKTFMWPKAAWEKLYEPMIRRAAGLGRASELPDPDHYDKVQAHCDLLVIGAGPAGLAAALTAGRAGARVILVDEDFRLGGRLNTENVEIDGSAGLDFVAATEAELRALPNLRVLTRTTAFGVYDDTYAALERVADHLAEPAPYQPRQRLWRINARRAVLAAGALDRPIVFGGNDRPGVMLAAAMETYVSRFAAAPASRLAVFANNDAAWGSAFAAHDAGVTVSALIDTRADVSPVLAAKAKARGLRVVLGGRICDAHGKALTAIDIVAGGRTERLAVDGLAMSGGFSPNLQLTCHHNGKPVWNDDIAAFVPGTPPPGMSVAGAANGSYDLGDCLREGAARAVGALADLGIAATALTVATATLNGTAVSAFWHVAEARTKAFVDFQNDVCASDIVLAEKEGFRSVEHLKRYTTLGMATDQGKLSNMPGLAIMAAITGKSIPETGTTVFRPPYTPVAIGALAGHHRGKDFRPTRLTPLHGWAREQGAVFIEAGPWLRAQYFPRGAEKTWDQAVNREVRAVREGVGLIDVSTFGKIDLRGRDVGAFLDRVYINTFSTLAVGKTRYGLMLREDGFVMDDGTTARLAPDRWVMTTTTANAAKVFQHLEFCAQVLWPELDVQLTSVSEQWAQVAIAGPRARDVLARVIDDPATIDNGAFPYMSAMETRVMGGVRARVFRLSFAGDLGFEIAVPARQGEALARALMQAGAEFDITPYGLETLGVMRIEKGHVTTNELNGQTTALDLGFGKMAKKGDFIGKVMAGRPGLVDPDRPRLAGFKPVDPNDRLRAGAHFIAVGAAATTENDLGWMTSTTWSPTFGHALGLGFVKGGTARIGERLRAVDPLRGGDVLVEVCNPVFFDPEGVRLRG